MALDLEHIMILLHRRFNCVKEISRLTDDLADAFSRNDQVTADMILDMRAEEMAKADSCTDEIWTMAEQGSSEAAEIRRLMNPDLTELPSSGSAEEQKIYEIRRKLKSAMESLQEKDQRLNRRVGGEKSIFYGKEAK